jgi:hypothetical protein
LDTILPRGGARESVTSLQQRVLATLLRREQFCIVDFLLAEMEDAITIGFKAKAAVLPYASFISYMQSRIGVVDRTPELFHDIYMAASSFPFYRAQAPSDPRVPAQVTPEAEGAESEGEEHEEHEEHAQPETGVTFRQIESDSDDEAPVPLFPPRPHDTEAGSSQSVPPPPPPPPAATVTES